MSTPRFDLVDIVQTIRQRRRFVIVVTVIAAIMGAIFYFTGKKEYTAKAEFFITNPLLSDRNSLFGGSDAKLDYFADEDDIDRVIALSESDTVVVDVIRKSGFDAYHKLDLNKPKELDDLKSMYLKNLKVKRTEYTMMQIGFSDKDAEMAANVANTTVAVLEAAYRNFYNSKRRNIHSSLLRKYEQQDSIIMAMTDTLAVLRDESGIYDLISPNRNNLVSSTITGKGEGKGRYVEQIQNVEAIKDGIVMDQTRITTLLQQFSTGTNEDELRLFHLISNARAPIDHSGPGLILVILASVFLGFLFSTIYILLTTYYKVIVSTER